MSEVSFGTAQLYGLAGGATPATMLEAAWRAGFRRFDTAPMYGGGRAEVDVGRFLHGRLGVEAVTTKAGRPPDPRRPVRDRTKQLAKRVLSEQARQRVRELRGRGAPWGGEPEHEQRSGRFAVPAIEASVAESLRRLGGRIDRLMLHEVRPLDVSAELLSLLARLLEQGDVGVVGVATQNRDTAGALAAGRELFEAANIAVGPLDAPVELPAHVTTRIGHGLLGGGGSQLRRMQAVLDTDRQLRERWDLATADTPLVGAGGLATALLWRGQQLGLSEIIVGTTRLDRVAGVYASASLAERLPPAVVTVLEEISIKAPAAGR